MPLTDHCDLYGAIHEDGFNLVAHHLRRQRPSLFNYGTQLFAAQPDLLCRPIAVHPDVLRRHNPLLTIEDPLPILGTSGALGLDFCFQLTELKLDIHPGNQIQLPPQLHPPLAAQRLALLVEVCAGLACPDREIAERYGEMVAASGSQLGISDRPSSPDTQSIRARRVLCFCLDLFAVVSARLVGPQSAKRLSLFLEGLEIVDIKPDGLEDSLECYLATTLRVGLLPRVRPALDTLVFEMGQFGTLTLSPTPIPATVPHNPALEQDQLKAFINVGV